MLNAYSLNSHAINSAPWARPIAAILKAAKPFADMAKQAREVQLYKYKYRQNIIALWEKFEEELKTQNRYFPKSEFIDFFNKYAIKDARHELPKKTILYRARKIETNELSLETNEIISKIQKSNRYSHHHDVRDIWDYIIKIPDQEWNEDFLHDASIHSIKFWGFDEKQSDAPLSNNSFGRANPMGISYLYAASNEETAIAEIQPTINQLVSVAKIEILAELNLFSFNFHEAFRNSELMEMTLDEIKKHNGLSYDQLHIFFDTIAELFSKPILGKVDNYYATQYLSEMIKQKEFDGIIYNSSLFQGGSNIVLFDVSSENNPSKNYKILESSLFKIENVAIISKKILPK